MKGIRKTWQIDPVEKVHGTDTSPVRRSAREETDDALAEMEEEAEFERRMEEQSRVHGA